MGQVEPFDPIFISLIIFALMKREINTQFTQLPSREPNRMVKNIASANLSIDEVRVLAKIVEAFRPEQKMRKLISLTENLFGDKILKFRYSDLVPENHKNYTGLSKALSSLRQRSADTLTAEKDVIDGWITKAVHDKRKGEVEIVIGKEIVPEYVALGDGYTEYLSNTVFSLNSKYAIHIYKLLAKNKDRTYFNLYVSHLKSYLGIPEDTYTTIKDFKRRVLQPAYEELKEKADICFEIDWKTKVKGNEEEIGVLKNGRIITGYRVKIINHKTKTISQSQEQKILLFVDNFMKRVGINKRDGLARMSLRNWCMKYGTDQVIDKLNGVTGYIKKSKKKLDYIQKVLVKEFEKKKDIDPKELERIMSRIRK